MRAAGADCSEHAGGLFTDSTGMLLDAWGHTVAAYSGLEMVQREKPGVVLMDIGLPG